MRTTCWVSSLVVEKIHANHVVVTVDDTVNRVSQLSVDDEFLKFCQSTFRSLFAVMIFADDDWLLRVLSLCLKNFVVL